MAARAATIVSLITLIAIGALAWCITGGMLLVRYNADLRPQQRPYEIFPYGVLRVGIDPSNPPYAFYADNEMIGLDLELSRAIAAHIGIKVQFVPLGFDGLYDSLFTDGIDMLTSMNVDSGRFDKVTYVEPYFDNGWVLVTASETTLQSWRDLSSLQLALEFGSEGDGLARGWSRRIAPFEVLPYELPDYALDAVRYGQADVALVENITLSQYMREHPDFGHHASFQTNVPLALAIRSDHLPMAQKIREVIQLMQQTGELQAILARWL